MGEKMWNGEYNFTSDWLPRVYGDADGDKVRKCNIIIKLHLIFRKLTLQHIWNRYHLRIFKSIDVKSSGKMWIQEFA